MAIIAPTFDADLLSALHGRCFPKAWSVQTFVDQLASPGVSAFCAAADIDDPPQGFAVLRAIAGEAEILTIGVEPQARRRGLGRRLVEVCAEGARAGDAAVIHLEVAINNAAALACYLAAGFSRTGRRPGYYAGPSGRIDAVLLSRPLCAR